MSIGNAWIIVMAYHSIGNSNNTIVLTIAIIGNSNNFRAIFAQNDKY